MALAASSILPEVLHTHALRSGRLSAPPPRQGSNKVDFQDTREPRCQGVHYQDTQSTGSSMLKGVQ